MKSAFAIYKREIASYFSSSLAYIATPIFLALVGVFSLYIDDIFDHGLVQMSVVFRWIAIFLILLAPAITMRLLAEERNSGSIELLLTLPVSEPSIVIGKFLAAWSLVLITIGLTISYPITLACYGALDWGPVIGGYLGLCLMSAAYCAIGVAASSLTRSQILAFLGSLVICLVPYAIGFSLHKVPAEWVGVIQNLSFEHHFSSLARGVIDTRNIIFYGSVVALALHVAVFSLETRRLRR